MDNCFYTIGREGHISIPDRTVSRLHAEIHIKKGDIYLRDLNSTNGTFLLKNERIVPFLEGYVQLNQIIVLGNVQCRVQKLLELAGEYRVPTEDGTTNLANGSRKFRLRHPRQKNRFSIWADNF